MAAQEYLYNTEPAVRYLFDGLNSYDSMQLPSIRQYTDKTGMIRMTKVENKVFLENYEKFFDFEFARATLAGSILQVAYNWLKQYSPGPNDSIPFSKFNVKRGKDVEKFCVGRQVHGIPIGLLIYAGRIQYNHWEEGLPKNTVAQTVFNELIMAYYNDMSFDMAYELDYPIPRPIAHYIIRLELNWRTYDDYITDMQSLLELNKK
jgi:hypothetical protein